MTSDLEPPAGPASTGEGIERLSAALDACRRALAAERSLRAKLEAQLEAAELSEQRLRRVEQELAQKTSGLEATLENMDQGIYMLDRELRFVAYNQRLCQLLDLPDELLATQPTAEEVVAYQRAHGEFSSAEEASNPYLPERMGEAYRYERRRPNGTVVEVRSSPLPDGGWVRTVSDVTERARAAEALRQAKEAAEAGSRAKSEFLAMMSHEIRTPMNAMIGMTELTLETALDEEQTGYLEKALDASATLLAVINDILDFSKIEAGHLELEHIEFDLDEVLERVATVVGLEARAKSPGLAFSVAPEVPRKLIGDPVRLGQVLTNLADNAVKFSARGPVVVEAGLAAWQGERSRLSFAVHDSGIGLGEDEQKRVFDAFSQADLSTTRRYGGTGLGLSISKRLVELMGGEISVRSAPGEGTTVRFTAELRVAEEPRGELAPPRGPPTRVVEEGAETLAGSRVLLVEDNLINQQVARGILQRAGMTVEVAENGRAAVARACGGTGPALDAVLMDLHMPEMDGYEATRLIREKLGAGLPIIAMTAHAMAGERERCLRAGMNEHVAKPVSPRHLLGALRDWVAPREPIHPAPAPSLPAAVPGIDLREGLERLTGDADLYRRLLGAFAADAAGRLRDVTEALASGDRDAAARAAHSLQGSAGNLAARRLHDASAALETTLRATGSPPVHAPIAELEAALAEVLSSVAGLDLLERPRRSSGEAPAAALDVRLEELAELLGAKDLGAGKLFEAIAERYDLSRVEPEAGELRRQLARLRYGEALGALDAIRRVLADEGSTAP